MKKVYLHCTHIQRIPLDVQVEGPIVHHAAGKLPHMICKRKGHELQSNSAAAAEHLEINYTCTTHTSGHARDLITLALHCPHGEKFECESD